MSKKYRKQKIVDLSKSRLTHHAWERFIQKSGITDGIEAKKALKLILQKSWLYKKSKNSVIYRSENWFIVTKQRGKKPVIATVHKNRLE